MGGHSIKSPRGGRKHLVKVLRPANLHGLGLHRKTHLLQLGQDAFLTYADFLFEKGLTVCACGRVNKHKESLCLGLRPMHRPVFMVLSLWLFGHAGAGWTKRPTVVGADVDRGSGWQPALGKDRLKLVFVGCLLKDNIVEVQGHALGAGHHGKGKGRQGPWVEPFGVWHGRLCWTSQ